MAGPSPFILRRLRLYEAPAARRPTGVVRWGLPWLGGWPWARSRRFSYALSVGQTGRGPFGPGFAVRRAQGPSFRRVRPWWWGWGFVVAVVVAIALLVWLVTEALRATRLIAG